MSLTDESQQILNSVARSIAEVCEGPDAGWGLYSDLLLPIKRRLSAIETELNELRKIGGAVQHQSHTVTNSPVTERSSALPCSNTSDWNDETGG